MYASLKELIVIDSSVNDIGPRLLEVNYNKKDCQTHFSLDFLVSHERFLVKLCLP